MSLALAIFILTIVLVIWQPRGIGFGTVAVMGAIVSLLLGTVSLGDALEVTGIVWDATLAFIGIIILSLVLDQIGFFEWSALHMARLSRGNGNLMFVYMLVLGALVSAFFANDGAALILTPILLAQMHYLRASSKATLAFLLAGGFIADSASNPLVISNLTNIVTAGYFGIGFLEYARVMFFPNLLSILASIAVLWLFFRRAIPAYVEIESLPKPSSAIKSPVMFKLSWYFLALLLVGYFIGDIYHLPISLFALGGALLFLLLATLYRATDPLLVLKSAPWQVVWFSIGLYIVVFGLKNAGLTDEIGKILSWLHTQGEAASIVGTGFLAAFLSSVMNNMPTIMVMDIAIDHMGESSLAYANILGCNLGPKMTPIGSLATLLWLHVLAQKGVRVTWGAYMKVGLIITPPVLFVALLGLL